MKLHAFLCCLTLSTLSLCQTPDPVSLITPDQPAQGGSITAKYFPKKKGARLDGREQIYAVVHITNSDYSTDKVLAKLATSPDEASATIQLPRSAAHFNLYFFTKSKPDFNNSLSSKVYRADGKPARTAYANSFDKDFQGATAKELELYPDNHYAYRCKWFAASAFDRPNYESIVKTDMAKLAALQPTAELLAAQVYGHINLKDEPKAREALKRLVGDYPTSPLVRRGFGDYDYGTYAYKIKGEGPDEIERLKIEHVKKYPLNKDFRDDVRVLSYSNKLPLEVVEAAGKAWLAEEPTNSEALEMLAKTYLTHGKAEEAVPLIEQAIDALMQGELRLWHDFSGQLEPMLLPGMYQTAAEVYLGAKQWSKALGAVRAAQSLDKSFDAKPHMLEGRVWREIGNNARATAAYEEAHRRGAEGAQAALKDLYAQRKGGEEGYTEYMASISGSAPASNSSGPPAPVFSVTGLDGKKYDLAELKGKVVVLNFWFIGCAPCRVEMPALNKLVQEYASNKDVVFIGFANDPDKDLREFLKKNQFLYSIVANGSAIASKYGVNAFPGHVVIGKDGKISSQSIGGSEDIDKQLRLRIQRALAAS
jgi:thiol-disulfide isomerase/thioredoxin